MHSFALLLLTGLVSPGPGGNKTSGFQRVEEPPLLKIHQVQGRGTHAAVTSAQIQGVVTLDLQRQDQLKGFFVQEEDSDQDGDPQTSEGIFVYCGACKTAVDRWDLVRVQGEVTEYYGMTNIKVSRRGKIAVIKKHLPLPKPVEIRLPIRVDFQDPQRAHAEIDRFYEAKEGMRVRFVDPLFVSESYHLARYNSLWLQAKAPPRAFTDQLRPSAEGFAQHALKIAAGKVIWDDDTNRQNAALTDGKSVKLPRKAALSHRAPLRHGDRVLGLQGVLHWSYAGSPGTNAWRVRSGTHEVATIERSNRRPRKAPKLRGDFRVASFNLSNFFSTIDDGKPRCAPSGQARCRGADSVAERKRQLQKLSAAICGTRADLLGVMELENNAQASAQMLVSQLQGRCGKFAYVDTGVIGSDAIKVAILYRPHVLSAVGGPKILDHKSFVDPRNSGRGKNRPALAQRFRVGQKEMVVVVNHLKSKGSSCGAGDDDSTRGQGNCNLTRTLAAKREVEWLQEIAPKLPVLVLGDLNAYRYEEPVQAFQKAGYVDLLADRLGNLAYSYVYKGQRGYLDHAMANQAMLPFVQDVGLWHINADECSLLDYNDKVQDEAERFYHKKPDSQKLFAPDAFRSSDHDPVVLGISLQ